MIRAAGRGLVWVCVLGLVGCAGKPAESPSPTPATPAARPLTSECAPLIAKVNRVIGEIEKLAAAKPSSNADIATQMRKLGGLYDGLAQEVDAIEITNADLHERARAYGSICKRAATTARQVARAVETNDKTLADRASKDFDKIVAEEDELVNSINRLCQGG